MENPTKFDEWGPSLWKVLHVFSFNYGDNPDSEDKRSMYNFLHSVKGIIPCIVCKKHYEESLHYNARSVNSSVFDNRYNLSKYIVNLHNQVNKRNGKEIWTYERALRNYSSDEGECEMMKLEKENKVKLDVFQFYTFNLYIIIALVFLVFVFVKRRLPG